MHIHLVHIVADEKFHGLFGYQEVLDTLRWGFEQLGCTVTSSRNTIREGATHVVLGGQLLQESDIARFQPDTIFYNLEQLAGIADAELKPVLRAIAARCHVWDYSERNIPVWQRLNPAHPLVLVPIGYAPVLERIPKRADEDIDVLFYGLPSEPRLSVFQALCTTGMKCVFACGLYGASRDDLIARSKVVLNINMYDHARIFEVVRVSYLLANRKAVVSDTCPDSFIEPDLNDAVLFAPLEDVTATCLKLVQDDASRKELETRGHAIFQRRDIRAILRANLK